MQTIDITDIIDPDQTAVEIAGKWTNWNNLRRNWLEEKKELRNYLYATDTKTTSNSMLPWSNSTTTPKLTQIMDNLHANYFVALFPQKKWMKFEADNPDSNTKAKRDAAESYIQAKLRQSDFVNTVSDILYDYIQYGNCFATVDWEQSYFESDNGELMTDYVGPRLVRISPFDICFNPTAANFNKTPKIIKAIKSLGEVKKLVDNNPTDDMYRKAFEKALANRAEVGGQDKNYKSDGFVADGFNSITEYYESNYVEFLTYYGDIYDRESGQLLDNRVITIIDRAYVISNKKQPSWLGQAPVFHAGWRPRPDNLYAMGPLDNLVGMQYRIDHLENLKADVFDQIAYPVLKIRGDVEDFDFEPNARIYLGEEGDVGYLSPDPTALQADLQIQILESKMEMLAGAPREAMGIRTAGEKTAFEVQSLMSAASRIFEHKTAHFERVFLEPVLNSMLEVARRNMDMSDIIKVIEPISGVEIFKTITKDDLKSKGKLVPIGARHFAERARRLQNMTQLYQIKLADPSVAVHLSGKEFARILSEELGEEILFKENIAVEEQLKTQQAVQDAEVQNEERLMLMKEAGL